MIHLVYVGNHKNDSLSVRLGWRITRLAQSGEYRRVTHTECVLAGNHYTNCTIASASLRDGGIRIKQNVALTHGNWMAFDVPSHNEMTASNWFQVHLGEKYNMLGAIATKIAGLRWLALKLGGWFCNWACLESCGVLWAHKETPSQSIERLVKDHGAIDVTDIFFKVKP